MARLRRPRRSFHRRRPTRGHSRTRTTHARPAGRNGRHLRLSNPRRRSRGRRVEATRRAPLSRRRCVSVPASPSPGDRRMPAPAPDAAEPSPARVRRVAMRASFARYVRASARSRPRRRVVVTTRSRLPVDDVARSLTPSPVSPRLPAIARARAFPFFLPVSQSNPAPSRPRRRRRTRSRRSSRKGT